MKIAFITDPLRQFKICKDTSFAMMREAQRRGHQVYAFGPESLVWQAGVVSATVQQIRLTGEAVNWYEVQAETEMALTEFDLVLQRKDPPFDMEYVYATYLLELAEQQGARIYNKPAAIRNHNEKLSIAQFSEFAPLTMVTRDAARIRAFHAEHQDIILKPLDGMGGTGIFRIGRDGMNLGSVIETLTENGQRSIMVQGFIPEIAAGDKRIILIAGKAVPYALARIPQNGEVRGNLAAGGRGVAQPLSPRDWQIANALGPELFARGLFLVGLDVIGDYLTEVNVTSPTCFQEISEQSDCDVAALFLDALEAL